MCLQNPFVFLQKSREMEKEGIDIECDLLKMFCDTADTL